MKKLLSILAMMLGMHAGSASAVPMIYTFEGIVNNHSRYSDEFTPEEFGVVLGETKVTYTFLVDFDESVRTHTTSTGTWEYFYNDLLSGQILNGEGSERNRGYNITTTSPTWPNSGSLSGGNRVKVHTNKYDHPDNWRVQDWYVGQAFRFLDSGYFSGRGAFYLFGNVELTSITPPAAVPEPSSALLFLPAFALLLERKKFARNKT